jgi:hypothetical protein
MKATRPSKTLVLIRPTRRHMQDGGNLHSLRCENLKSYKLNIRLHLFKLKNDVLKNYVG